MAVQLTEAERELAEKLISNMERHSRSWPRARLVALALALLLMCTAVLSFALCAQGMRFVADPILRADREITAADVAFDAQSKIEIATATAAWYATSLVLAVAAICLLGNTICNWNRHRQDGLLARLLRAQVEPNSSEELAAVRQPAEPTGPPKT